MKILIKKLYQHSGNVEVINITKAMMIFLCAFEFRELYKIIYSNQLKNYNFLIKYMAFNKHLKYILLNYSAGFRDKIIPKDILYQLAKDKDSRTRVELAAAINDFKSNKDIFELLARDKLVGVRRQIARNDNTENYIYEWLCNDVSKIVRNEATDSLGHWLNKNV